ncbi:MAG: hypothetical protein K0Q49_1946 [Haloplasmataceae bacterium]|jgi:hypothetical protein|nr:hypothetical protein [Haloplasmataceae bacterium]
MSTHFIKNIIFADNINNVISFENKVKMVYNIKDYD